MEGAMDPSMKQPGAPPPGAKNEVKRLWITKVSLRSVAAVTSLIVIGCCGASPYGNPMLLGPAGGAFLWCVAEGITLIVRRRTYKGIHPGACVGVDLILWLAVGVMSGFQVPMYLTYYGYETVDEDPGLHIAAMAVGLITTCLLFATFVIACIETHRRRNKKAPLAPGAPFYPNQQPGGAYNPNQPSGGFNPNQQQQPGAFNPNQQPGSGPFNPQQQQQQGAFIPNQHPTTFPPTSPYPGPAQMRYYPPPGTHTTSTQTQTQTPSPQSSTAQPYQSHPHQQHQQQQPFGQATVSPGWLGSSNPTAQAHEMSSSPAPHLAGGGPPHLVGGGFTAAQPHTQHELSSNTPAVAPAQAMAQMGGFIPTAQQQHQQQAHQQYATPGASQAGSPPPRYEMYVASSGPEGGVSGFEMGGGGAGR